MSYHFCLGLLVCRRELAELGYGSGNDFDCGGDFFSSGVAAEAETDGGARFFGGQADGREDVRRFDGAGRASGAGRAGKSF